MLLKKKSQEFCPKITFAIWKGSIVLSSTRTPLSPTCPWLILLCVSMQLLIDIPTQKRRLKETVTCIPAGVSVQAVGKSSQKCVRSHTCEERSRRSSVNEAGKTFPHPGHGSLPLRAHTLNWWCAEDMFFCFLTIPCILTKDQSILNFKTLNASIDLPPLTLKYLRNTTWQKP